MAVAKRDVDAATATAAITTSRKLQEMIHQFFLVTKRHHTHTHKIRFLLFFDFSFSWDFLRFFSLIFFSTEKKKKLKWTVASANFRYGWLWSFLLLRFFSKKSGCGGRGCLDAGVQSSRWWWRLISQLRVNSPVTTTTTVITKKTRKQESDPNFVCLMAHKKNSLNLATT